MDQKSDPKILNGHKQDYRGWPWASRNYDALTMDAEQVSWFLSNDTAYANPEHVYGDFPSLPWYLEYVYFAGEELKMCEFHPANLASRGVFADEVLVSRLTVIHLRQKRRYLDRATVSAVSVDVSTWSELLQHFDVLPSFVELLHNNNGGVMSYTSYSDAKGDVRPTAFHTCYKMGDWGNEETAVYARRDIVTGQTFVLMMGTRTCIDLDIIHQLLSDRPDATLFHITFSVLSTTLKFVEETRWKVDYETQDLEKPTGTSSFRAVSAEPMDVENLEFSRSLQVTADFARNLAWGSVRVPLHFEALASHLAQYRELCTANTIGNAHGGASEYQIPDAPFHNLLHACRMKGDLARNQYDQIMQLQARLKAQHDNTTTLMAQRDAQLTIEIAEATKRDSELMRGIAEATKRDSELMRGIAAVTMIFFPATFVATFFSMVFFHVGDEKAVRLLVDRRIWLYPVVTVPLTIFIATWYFAWSLGWTWVDVKNFVRKKRAR